MGRRLMNKSTTTGSRRPVGASSQAKRPGMPAGANTMAKKPGTMPGGANKRAANRQAANLMESTARAAAAGQKKKKKTR